MITDLCPPYRGVWCDSPTYVVMVAHSKPATPDHLGTLVAWLCLPLYEDMVLHSPAFHPAPCDGPQAPTMLKRGSGQWGFGMEQA